MLDDAAQQVPTDAAGEGEGALEVHGVAGLEVAEVGALVGLFHDVGEEAVLVEVDGGEVAAVDRDRVAEVGAPGDLLRVEHEPSRRDLADGAYFFDDAQ